MGFPDPATGDDWMRALATHYEAVRARHPADELAVLFDIDGTILDLRHLSAHILLSHDRVHGTDRFHGLVADDITVPENQVEQLLGSLGVPDVDRPAIAAYYRAHLWNDEGVLAASAPYRGVLGVIRWFQLQPGTRIVLNTGRPEAMRRVTLDSLNAIGEAARVAFDPELLFMRGGELSVSDAKVAALEEICAQGLRPVAVIDNEPDNLAAMATARATGDILFLHADTMYESQRPGGLHLARGSSYELGGLITEERLREHVELVWHGVNDEENLRQFLGSGIRWAEVDLRRDPVDRLVLRHDGFGERPWTRSEPTMLARSTATAIADAERSLKIDVKEGGATVRAALDLLDEVGLDSRRVWFNGRIDDVGREGFEAFRERHPASTASCPVDFVVPLLAAGLDEAAVVLKRLRAWGLTRLSVRWAPDVRHTIDELERRGWETNVYAVPDLQSFLEAAVLLPTSVTADFNFPAWHYFGRGSGERDEVRGLEGSIP